MYLKPQNCTLKNILNGKFTLGVFYNIKKTTTPKSIEEEKNDEEKVALFLSCNPNRSYLDAAS